MPPAKPEKVDAAKEDAAQEDALQDAPNAARAGSAGKTAAQSPAAQGPSAAATPESPEGREGATRRGLKLHHLRPAPGARTAMDIGQVAKKQIWVIGRTGIKRVYLVRVTPNRRYARIATLQ